MVRWIHRTRAKDSEAGFKIPNGMTSDYLIDNIDLTGVRNVLNESKSETKCSGQKVKRDTWIKETEKGF